jgi:predicted phosphoribosyltransferase
MPNSNDPRVRALQKPLVLGNYEAVVTADIDQLAEHISLAVPVADRQVLARLAALVERTTVLAAVADLQAVGLWYRHFEQLTDAQVLELLAAARRR